MIVRILRFPAIALSWLLFHRETRFPPRVVMRRPVWDNGINYDIPTYLRRNAV